MFGGENEKYGPGKIILILSLVSVIIAGIDKFFNMTLLDMGADSWMLVAILLAVWSNSVKQWKSS